MEHFRFIFRWSYNIESRGVTWLKVRYNPRWYTAKCLLCLLLSRNWMLFRVYIAHKSAPAWRIERPKMTRVTESSLEYLDAKPCIFKKITRNLVIFFTLFGWEWLKINQFIYYPFLLIICRRYNHCIFNEITRNLVLDFLRFISLSKILQIY